MVIKSEKSLIFCKNSLIFLGILLYWESQISLGDGTGRHARLKIWWLHGRAGSSPALGNLDDNLDLSSDFFLFLNKNREIFRKKWSLLCILGWKKYSSFCSFIFLFHEVWVQLHSKLGKWNGSIFLGLIVNNLRIW